MRQAFEVFDLYQQAHLLIGVVEVTGHGIPARCTSQGAADAANTLGRIMNGAHQVFGLLGRVDHGYQQRLGTEVKQLLDHYGIADRGANYRMRRVGRDRLQLPEQAGDVVGRVLGVEQQPVEACIGG